MPEQGGFEHPEGLNYTPEHVPVVSDRTLMRRVIVTAAILAAAMLAVAATSSCSLMYHGRLSALQGLPARAKTDASATFPPGRQGAIIRYGHDLIEDTPRYAGGYISAQMSCAACHPQAGRQPHAGSFLGTYARFPQRSKRANRFIALQDRFAECFLYSMNGKPPPYDSREMIALTAYIAFLSRDAPVGDGFADQGPVKLAPGLTPDIGRGSQIYSTRCLACHGASGAGVPSRYPPLWGPASFDDMAGMNHLDHIAPFVRVAMPQNAPGSLTDQEALDVSAFLLTKPRPHFRRNKKIYFPTRDAGYF